MHSKSFAHGLLTLSLTAFTSLSFAQNPLPEQIAVEAAKRAALEKATLQALSGTTLRDGNLRITPSVLPKGAGYPTQIQFMKLDEALKVREPLNQRQYLSAVRVLDLSNPLQMAELIYEIQRVIDADTKENKLLSKGQKRGLEEMKKLAKLIKDHETLGEPKLTPEAALDVRATLQALSLAYNSQFVRPIKDKEDLLSIFPRLANQMGTTSSDAINVAKVKGQDFSKVDPADGSFWKKPENIAKMDLTLAARAKSVFNGKDAKGQTLVCDYDEPKTGYGIHPGFEIKCGELKLKLKFGNETHAEPFVSRIFNALGFNTPRVDYVPELKINYAKNGRKVMTEYNLRKSMTVKLTAFWIIPIRTIDIGGYVNPFDDIKGAEMIDGSVINVEQLKAGLFGDKAALQGDQTLAVPIEANEANYNVAFERNIKNLIMNKGNVEFKEGDIISIGSWDWNDEYISSRREAKGVGLLAAFMNTYDTRRDNTRLKLYKKGKDNYELRHVISDLGSGLGKAAKFMSTSNQTVNDYPMDSFVAFQVELEDGQRMRIKGFNPIDYNDSFENMSLDDARWMARWIAQITEEQYKQALVVSGFSSEEVMAYMPKLLSRRDQMVYNLGLGDEIPYLIPSGKEVRFTNYDPRKDGLVSVTNSLGQTLTAPDGGSIVVKGKLVPRL